MAKQLLPEEVWREVETFLPSRPRNPKGGRPPLGDREALTGILFVLRTGVAWPDLPEELGCGCGMTCLRRLREWQEASVWHRIEDVLRKQLPNPRAINWARAVGESKPYVRGHRPYVPRERQIAAF